MRFRDFLPMIIFIVIFFGGYSYFLLNADRTIEIPREDGCVEIVTEDRQGFSDTIIRRKIVCTKEIG